LKTRQDGFFLLLGEGIEIKKMLWVTARDQYLAADGFTPKNYRSTDPLLSEASALTRRKRHLARALRTVWPEA
jgi:hypothetical protein